ncbi:hypothetical protein L210DRAFT_3315472, partial [Boletus edulis BED1]
NEHKIIWSLHQIMQDTDMRFWYSSCAFLATSEPINFMTEIDDMIYLFYLIGSGSREALGWDPTLKRIHIRNAVQYKFKIGNCIKLVQRPLAIYGADAMVVRSTQVYEALDEEGNIVAIKDLWRDDNQEPEGSILERILKDIQDKLGEEEMAEAEKYIVKVLAYEDIFVTREVDKTLKPEEGDTCFEWIAIDADPILSTTRHLPSTGHISSSKNPPLRYEVCPPSTIIPCQVHAHTVFKEVALYYVHKAGYVHRDFSVNNILWFGENGQGISKLTDFEYVKKLARHLNGEALTIIFAGTMHFMAGEVEAQRYIFVPQPEAKVKDDHLNSPPFHMNFLHDLESHWWASMWFLLYHTDVNSPTEYPSQQLNCFNQVFPFVIAHMSHHYF